MIKESIVAMFVDGRTMSHELTRRIVSLKVTKRLGKADSGSIVFYDSDSELFDARIFRKGRVLHFILGWVDEAVPVGPFIVKSYKMSFPDSGVPSLTVNFQDLSHRLDKTQKRKKHTGKVKDILIRIAKSNSLGYDIDSIGGLEFTDDFPLNQASMSDAAMLQVLADRYGYVWGVRGGNLIFKRPADLELKKLGDPKVISYRINDCSVSSFDPEVKYISKGKKKGASSKDENIDFTADGIGDFVSEMLAGDLSEEERQELFAEHTNDAEEAVLIEQSIGASLEKNVGEGFRQFYHEAVDSTERLISWVSGTGYQTTAEASGKVESQWFTDKMREEVKKHSNTDRLDDPDAPQSIYEELYDFEQDDMTLATPALLEEAHRRQQAKKLKVRELVSAKCGLSKASVRYSPGETIIIAGVGLFFSGEYLIKEVEHSFSKGGVSFKTSLSVSRSRLGVSKRALTLISKKEMQVRSGVVSVDETISPDVYEPALVDIGIVKKVDNEQ